MEEEETASALCRRPQTTKALTIYGDLYFIAGGRKMVEEVLRGRNSAFC